MVSDILVWGLPQRHKTRDPRGVPTPGPARPVLRGTDYLPRQGAGALGEPWQATESLRKPFSAPRLAPLPPRCSATHFCVFSLPFSANLSLNTEGVDGPNE